MVELEWKEEGDLRPGQDPAWEEGLQHKMSSENEKCKGKVNVKLKSESKR